MKLKIYLQIWQQLAGWHYVILAPSNRRNSSLATRRWIRSWSISNAWCWKRRLIISLRRRGRVMLPTKPPETAGKDMHPKKERNPYIQLYMFPYYNDSDDPFLMVNNLIKWHPSRIRPNGKVQSTHRLRGDTAIIVTIDSSNLTFILYLVSHSRSVV